MAIKKQSDDFIQYVLEQLERMPNILCKRMFSGHGLYQGEHFFAILHKGRLYFKTDQDSQGDYEAYRMKPFSPREKVVLKHYFEVPVEILEDQVELLAWAKRAVQAAKQ